MHKAEEIKFSAGEKVGKVSGLLILPKGAQGLLVFAHGAGAGMRHRFMEETAQKLADHAIATFRYQFAYMEKGIKRPDNEAVLTATVRAAVATAKKHGEGLPLFAGGKSMGGRMTSLAAAKEPLESVRGLIYFGFPLHAAGRTSADRGQHLFDVKLPMLFLQGSRDALADLKLLKSLCARLGEMVELFVIDGGDHSFHLLKSSGRSDDQALDEAVTKTSSWISRLTR
jgi:predicted alpha/beta-hydrolase family hydrolase